MAMVRIGRRDLTGVSVLEDANEAGSGVGQFFGIVTDSSMIYPRMAASIAAKQDGKVREVPVSVLRERLLREGAKLA